jgi:hypothetical protein
MLQLLKLMTFIEWLCEHNVLKKWFCGFLREDIETNSRLSFLKKGTLTEK